MCNKKILKKTERGVNVGIFLRSTRVRKYYKFEQHITIFQIGTCATDMRAKETLNKSSRHNSIKFSGGVEGTRSTSMQVETNRAL